MKKKRGRCVREETFKPGFRFVDEKKTRVEVIGDIEETLPGIISCSLRILSKCGRKKLGKTCGFFRKINNNLIEIGHYANLLSTAA